LKPQRQARRRRAIFNKKAGGGSGQTWGSTNNEQDFGSYGRPKIVSTKINPTEPIIDPFKAMAAGEDPRYDPVSCVSQMPCLNKFGRKAAK